jgi:serine/threonine-protein kinase
MTEPERPNRRAELALLHALFDLTTEQRDLRLVEVERADRALADAVRRMLATSDAVAANAAERRPAAAEVEIGRVLGGRFRLLRPLGRGGMGEVYLARRDDGIEQHVAIKILHGEGLAVTRERARREQQILARLTHPNIAGLIDAGLTDAGRPWFAMDYVDGERLLEWCNHRALTLPARVRLFVPIARALQFAHRNLVLHRDVKPSNILVNQDGVPVLLDFGIAKVIDAQASAHETQTLALTPAYAAPEQLRGEPATTASEVYQLGIVLYELASGISAREACAHAQADTAALPAPQQAFAACRLRDRARAERLARLRTSSPQKLRRELKGDLGRIIAKASAPSPAERYDTVQALADDLERWLGGIPVSAHRGSWRYRLGKLVRRHKAASALTAVLALGLLAVSALALDRARREHEQRVEAERQRERSDALVDFFRSLFLQADPDLTATSDITANQLLEGADAALDTRNDVDPATRAALLSEIAAAFYNLGKPRNGLASAEQAVTLLTPRRADHPGDYLRSVDVAASIYASLGRDGDAVALTTQALPTARPLRDGDVDWYAKLLSRRGQSQIGIGQAQDAMTDIQAAIDEWRRRGALDGNDGVVARIFLAKLLSGQGDYRPAIDMLREVVEHGAQSDAMMESTWLAARNILGRTLLRVGEHRQAIALLEPALARDESLFGSESYPAITTRYQLLQCYLGLGEPERARVFLDQLQQVRPASIAQFGRAKDYVASATVRYQLATGRFGDAAKQAQQALDASVGESGTGDLPALLGEAQLQQGDPRRALATFARALEKDPASSGGSLRRASIEDGIGRAHLALGELDASIAHLSRAAEQFGRAQGADKPDALRSAIHLLWAQALATRDPHLLERLDAQRAALVGALGGEDKLQIWQFDRLRDRLARQLGQPGVDPARLGRAEGGLLRVSGAGNVPDYRGLTAF